MSNFPLAKQLHQLLPNWPPAYAVGDRHWQHVAYWCRPEQLRFLHNELGWDLDIDNSDEYGRNLITIYAYMDDMERVKAMHDLGYRVNLNHSMSPSCDGQIEPPGPLPTLDSKYLQYIKEPT
jgi:alpha-D-ribose 1-methylphosphonate 5-phosphate C-P lyase